MKKNWIKSSIIVIPCFTLAILFVLQWVDALPKNTQINMIQLKNMWKSFGATFVSQNKSDLNVLVVTNDTDKLWNRAYLPIKINSTTNKPVTFDLAYRTISNKGNASFFTEVRDNITNRILWSDFLNNTNGQFFNHIFTLPSTIKNKPIEFRLVIYTNGTGEHALDVRKSTLTFN